MLCLHSIAAMLPAARPVCCTTACNLLTREARILFFASSSPSSAALLPTPCVSRSEDVFNSSARARNCAAHVEHLYTRKPPNETFCHVHRPHAKHGCIQPSLGISARSDSISRSPSSGRSASKASFGRRNPGSERLTRKLDVPADAVPCEDVNSEHPSPSPSPSPSSASIDRAPRGTEFDTARSHSALRKSFAVQLLDTVDVVGELPSSRATLTVLDKGAGAVTAAAKP